MKTIVKARSSKGRDRNIVIGGCRLPRHAPVGVKLKDFLHVLPSSPATVDWSAAAITVIEDVEGNGNYGDCVMAEDAHYIAVATGNAGALFVYTDAMTLADYSTLTGFDPNDPSTDQGTDPIADLNYRVKTGYADGSKDAGWALVDAANRAEVEYALATFGNLKMWFGIPDSIVASIPSASGFVWDVAAGSPNQNNGHCIGSAGYNVRQVLVVGVTDDGLLVMTWGMLGIITWAAVAAWFVPAQGGGLAVRVTNDWVSKSSGKTPSGLNLSGLITAFNTYFGGNLPMPPPQPLPPGPDVPPSPTPAPSPPLVSLAQAQAWASAGASAGLEANWPQS